MIFMALFFVVCALGGLLAFRMGAQDAGVASLTLAAVIFIVVIVSLGRGRTPAKNEAGTPGEQRIGSVVALFFIVVMLLVMTGNKDAGLQVFTAPGRILGALVSPPPVQGAR